MARWSARSSTSHGGPAAARYRTVHDDEATPSLPPVAGIDVEEYKRLVRERFANPAVGDQVARVCLDGSSKWPKFLIPTIESQLERGGAVTLSALALASWCQYLLGRDDQGRPMTLSADPRMEQAQRHAQASLTDPAAFLGFVEVFGERLPRDETFVADFTRALSSLREVGTHRTLERWLVKEG